MHTQRDSTICPHYTGTAATKYTVEQSIQSMAPQPRAPPTSREILGTVLIQSKYSNTRHLHSLWRAGIQFADRCADLSYRVDLQKQRLLRCPSRSLCATLLRIRLSQGQPRNIRAHNVESLLGGYNRTAANERAERGLNEFIVRRTSISSTGGQQQNYKQPPVLLIELLRCSPGLHGSVRLE